MNLIELLPGMALPNPLVDTEVYAPTLVRKTAQSGSHPTDINLQSAIIGSARHSVIHDVADVEMWSGTGGGETLYDLLVYNVGWSAPDRGHGHGLYTQNLEENAVRVIDSCVFIAGFSLAAKVYAESEQPRSDGSGWQSKCANYIFRNCVFLGGSFYLGNIKVDKLGAINVIVEDCVFIDCNVFIGYKGPNRDVQFRRNTVFNGQIILGGLHQGTEIADNTLVITRPIKYAINLPITPVGSYASTGNVIYSDDTTLYEPEWSLSVYQAQGWDPWGWTDVRPLSAFGQRTWTIPVPEKNAEWVVAYNPENRETLDLPGDMRIRDVRRWSEPYVGSSLIMTGTPTPPRGWDAETWGAAPVPGNALPLVGIFRLEFLTLQEKLDMANAQIESLRMALQGAQAAVDALETAIDAKDAAIEAAGTTIDALNAQVAVLISERDEAIARASIFQGALQSIAALVQPHLPPA